MKKDDGLLGSGNDEEEDLFDLSLDDLEPGDTIVDPHVDEPDEDIIELIDLVEKGDIGLADEDTGPATLVDTIQDFAADEGIELKTEETLDLLDIQLDEPVDLGRLEELKEEAGEIDAVEISDSDLFIEKDFIKPVEPVQTTEVIFDDIADESAIKDLIADETEKPGGAPWIEGQEAPETTPVEDKTIRINPPEALSPEPVPGAIREEAERQPVFEAEEEKTKEAPPVEEAAQAPPPEAIPPVISEERIEAAIRDAVAVAVERVVRETTSEVFEKAAREIMTDIIERTARETMADLKERIVRETNEMVEKVARETTTSVAERVIGDAINMLKNSIESA